MSTAANLMSIGALSRRTGTSVATIRFYEQQGLLEPAERTPSGYRQFQPETVSRLRFIERAKGLGFSLADILTLMNLEEQPGASAVDVKRAVVEKIGEIDGKLDELTRMRDSLKQLAARCDGQADLQHCPILESLHQEADEQA